MYTVGMGRSLARGWRLAVGSGWMYTLGMDVHGRDGAQSGARLAVGGWRLHFIPLVIFFSAQ